MLAIVSYSAVISACGKDQQVVKALEAFAETKLNEARCEQYIALVSACGKG